MTTAAHRADEEAVEPQLDAGNASHCKSGSGKRRKS